VANLTRDSVKIYLDAWLILELAGRVVKTVQYSVPLACFFALQQSLQTSVRCKFLGRAPYFKSAIFGASSTARLSLGITREEPTVALKNRPLLCTAAGDIPAMEDSFDSFVLVATSTVGANIQGGAIHCCAAS
jgi:hypothetical protein